MNATAITAQTILRHASLHADLGGSSLVLGRRDDAAFDRTMRIIGNRLAQMFPSAVGEVSADGTGWVCVDLRIGVTVHIDIDGAPHDGWVPADTDAWSLAVRAAGLELEAMAKDVA